MGRQLGTPELSEGRRYLITNGTYTVEHDDSCGNSSGVQPELGRLDVLGVRKGCSTIQRSQVVNGCRSEHRRMSEKQEAV